MSGVTLTDAELSRVAAEFLSSSTSITKRFSHLFLLRNVAAAQRSVVVDTLERSLTDARETSALLKHEVCYVLGQMRDERACALLERVLANADENCMVRHEAAEALGAIASESSVAALERHRDDAAVEVAETCQIALDRLRWQREVGRDTSEQFNSKVFLSVDPAPPIDAPATTTTTTTPATTTTTTTTTPATPTPTPATSADDVRTLTARLTDVKLSLFERYRAMFSLRNARSDDAVAALAASLSDPSSALFRHEVAFVLGQLQSSVAVDALCDCLARTDEHPMVRHEAAEALGAIGTDTAVDVLRSYLKDPEQVVRESCIVGLSIEEGTDVTYSTSATLEHDDANAESK